MKYSVIRSSARGGFSYTPPDRLYGAVRVLVLANRVEPDILANVLRGFWRFTPITRVFVAEHPALAPTMLNDNMRTVDLSVLPQRPFISRLPDTKKMVIAPIFLTEVDACIALNTLKVGDDFTISPSLEVVRDTTSRSTDLVNTYFCIGHMFAGSLVDTGDKIIWGDDLPDVDAAAYRTVNASPAPELAQIKQLSKLAKDIVPHEDHVD